VTLNTDNFSEAVSGGIYTYEATYEASSDGDYTATLNEASDGNGNDGADGEAVSLSVDTTAPSISSFSISTTSGQDIQISFISTEPVSTLEVSISGEEDATLTLSDFNETVSGEEYNYEATYQASSGGDYTATLIEASDSDDNDGAGSESASVTVPTDGIVAEDELISRWPFEENFEDGVGDNNATVVEGSPTTGDYSGRTATSFDGDVAMRVSRGEHDELSLLSTDDGPFSISMWVLFDSETGGTLGDQETPSHSLIRNDTGYRLSGGQAEDSDEIDIHFSVSPYGNGGANGYNMPEGDNVVVSIGTWHHLTVVCESESFVRIYIDGEIAFEDNSMDGYSEPSSEFWSDVTIGSWYGGNPEYWGNLLDGKLADVRIYESELSDEEISQIYNSS